MSEGDGLNLRGQFDLAMRNPGRTLLSVGVGVGALCLLGALNDGWLAQMQDNFTLTLTGHVQVHARGFEASQSLRDRLPDPTSLGARLGRGPAVAAWSARVRSSGLASLAGVSAGVQILGVEPEREPWVTRHGRPRHPGSPVVQHGAAGGAAADPEGALLGYLAGAAAVVWLAREGIDLSRFANAFEFFYMSPVIHSVLTLASGLRILGTTLLAALLAGLYPAWKAGRVCIPTALRRF